MIQCTIQINDKCNNLHMWSFSGSIYICTNAEAKNRIHSVTSVFFHRGVRAIRDVFVCQRAKGLHPYLSISLEKPRYDIKWFQIKEIKERFCRFPHSIADRDMRRGDLLNLIYKHKRYCTAMDISKVPEKGGCRKNTFDCSVVPSNDVSRLKMKNMKTGIRWENVSLFLPTVIQVLCFWWWS